MPVTGAQIIELTAHEIHLILERGAHDRLRINAHDMLKAYALVSFAIRDW